ncbi:prolipoprotein diacylglyceryl transferase [Ignavibacteria bacterium]|nr:prolipoprotein diacylglyceryl transferase [Bacteroidota bacterium]MCZ2133413.1 prolipoprotein diacylglyceryl transferase [Bacteroidota bacterium]
MYPILFEIGPIVVNSFGAMVAIAFLIANYLFTHELRRKQLPNADAVASTVTLLALGGGILGAKLFHLAENYRDMMADPAGQIFSGAGLTFYGGLLVAIAAIVYYARRKNIQFLVLADAAAPALILAYGIGRIGCQLAGDGDYGIPTDLPWGMAYPNGLVPTNEIVHPAPVYETLASVVAFLMLWLLRKKYSRIGDIFGLYLILAGIERLLVEFIRINPLYFGLSQAQWISIAMIIFGAWLFNRPGRK